jgi:small subunit ribosomal protein S13
MARVAGVELPRDKRIDVALRRIYGVGVDLSRQIVEVSAVPAERKVRDLTDEEVHRLQAAIGKHKVEGDLRREVTQNTKRLIEIGCYRGGRHQRNLPVHGQRTRTNARTRKGPRKTVGVVRGKQTRSRGPGRG